MTPSQPARPPVTPATPAAAAAAAPAPNTVGIACGKHVRVMLRHSVHNGNGHEISEVSGWFILIDHAGIYLGEDPTNPQFFVPTEMIGFIMVPGN